MIFEYRLLQYRENVDRQEGRNFALIVDDGSERHLRALGLDHDGTIVERAFEELKFGPPGFGWAFAEWLGWLQAHLENDSKAELYAALDRLATQDRDVFPTDPRTVEYLDDKTVDEAIMDLERRLIDSPRRRSHRFTLDVEAFLARSKIVDMKGFERNIEIEFTPKTSAPLVATFPYVLTEEPRAAFKMISHTARKDHLSRQINDAVLSFEKAVETGFLQSNRCFVLTNKLPASSLRYAAPLTKSATFVDVTEKGSRLMIA